ncbi:hypothetical protein D3C85_1264520 [compost metagenome]
MPDRPVAQASGRAVRSCRQEYPNHPDPGLHDRLRRHQQPARAPGQAPGAPGDQPRLRQGQLPEGGVRGQRQRRRRPLPAEYLELRQTAAGLPARPAEGQGAARRGRHQGRFQDHHLDPPLRQPAQPQPQPRRPVAAGRPGQGGHPGRDPRDRMGRADPPRQGRRARPAVHGLGRRQRRPGQLPHPAVFLRLGAVRPQLRALLRRRSGQADQRRQDPRRPGRAHGVL